MLAVSLQDAADIAVFNVQFQRDSGADLKAQADAFLSGFVVLFDDNSKPQRTVLNWAVPFELVDQTVPAAIGQQSQTNAADLGLVLFRTMSAAAMAETAGRITAAQAALLLLLYNLTWG